jgi:hypothetical protein
MNEQLLIDELIEGARNNEPTLFFCFQPTDWPIIEEGAVPFSLIDGLVPGRFQSNYASLDSPASASSKVF